MSYRTVRANHRSFVQMLLSFLFFLLMIIPVSASPIQRDYWPTERWRYSTPESQGMASIKLMKVIPFIINNLTNIQSLLVVRNGYIVFENYYGPGMPGLQDTVHSVTKSITSALVGIAKDQGIIKDLNQALPELLPTYFNEDTNPIIKEITLKHLLTMTAGLQPVKVKDWQLLMTWNYAPDRIKFTLDLPLVKSPGETFAYSNPISHLLSVIIEKRSKMNLSEFAGRKLFEPLGIEPRLWRKDAQGHNTGHGGLFLNTRQMAKIGFLYLNQGFWDNQQIISADWIKESTQEQIRADHNYAYGYQWWIRPVAGCRSYRAWGRNGQFIVVVPELDLVIAVTAETGLPGRSSGHYSPLFDIVAESVIDKTCPGNTVIVGERIVYGKNDLPDDLEAFFDGFSQAVESKRIDAIMNYYSDRFLSSGRRKPETSGYYRLMTQAIHEFKFRIDLCRIKGDQANIWGEVETNMGPIPLRPAYLLKENGSWKLFGNQKEENK